MRAITIASQKGGVGKTTTAVNLAAGLCLAGYRVLLLDLDPQANASSGVGFHRPAGGGSVPPRLKYISALLAGDEVQQFIRETRFANLSILPSTPEVSQLETVQALQQTDPSVLRARVRKVAEKFDYLLIDCPPSLSGLPTVALNIGESVIIPVQCEYYAMEGLSQILPVIAEIEKSTHHDLQIEGLLLTMFSENLELSRDVAEEVSGYFQELTFRTIIPRDVTLAEAASHGRPAIEYAPASRGAWGYIELAREVMRNG